MRSVVSCVWNTRRFRRIKVLPLKWNVQARLYEQLKNTNVCQGQGNLIQFRCKLRGGVVAVKGKRENACCLSKNPQVYYDLFKWGESMNNALAIRSMNLFYTNCQEGLHPVRFGWRGWRIQRSRLKADGPTTTAIDLQMSIRRQINEGLMKTAVVLGK